MEKTTGTGLEARDGSDETAINRLTKVQKTFEEWTKTHGGLNLTPMGNNFEANHTLIPGTYFYGDTEIAWRAWASAIEQKLDLAPALEDSTITLPEEFRSGNNIPVERATITRERMIEILTSNAAPTPPDGQAQQYAKAIRNAALEDAAIVAEKVLNKTELDMVPIDICYSLLHRIRSLKSKPAQIEPESRGYDLCIAYMAGWTDGRKSSELAQQDADTVNACPICSEDEPHTGTCGSSDPRALCNKPTQSDQAMAEDAEAIEVLRALVDLYVQNQGTEGEFITCITPPSARAMTATQRLNSEEWSLFDRARALLKRGQPASGEDALKKTFVELLTYAENQVCTHEDTHRGGAIWEICDSCDAKWADDEGGKPKFEWPQELVNARAAMQQEHQP